MLQEITAEYIVSLGTWYGPAKYISNGYSVSLADFLSDEDLGSAHRAFVALRREVLGDTVFQKLLLEFVDVAFERDPSTEFKFEFHNLRPRAKLAGIIQQAKDWVYNGGNYQYVWGSILSCPYPYPYLMSFHFNPAVHRAYKWEYTTEEDRNEWLCKLSKRLPELSAEPTKGEFKGFREDKIFRYI